MSARARNSMLRVVLRFLLVAAVATVGSQWAPRADAQVLVGNQTIESQVDQNALGRAEAFQTTANVGGTLATISVYLDSRSTAARLYAGLYTDNSGHPGTLLTQGSSTTLTPGAWNTISVTPVGVTAGSSYWFAILGTTSGTPYFRDRAGGCLSEASLQTGLASLPAAWSTGQVFRDCPLSAYGSAAVATTPVLSVSPTSISMSGVPGGTDPAPATVSVNNGGTGTLDFTAADDAGWLSVSPLSGTAPQTLQISASIAGLSAGTYTGHVTVTSAGAQNSPTIVTVTLTLAAPQPVLAVSPSTLSFSATQGGADPPPATLSVTNSGTGTLTFTATSNSTWLTVNPTSGTAPQGLQVSASAAGLAQGTYNGQITVTSPDVQTGPVTVPVTLSVGGAADWLMVEHDPARTGNASDETTITTANASNLTLSWSLNTDGPVTAQPIFVSGYSVAGQTRDVIIAATGGNSIYALDASTGAQLWKRNFGTQPGNCAIPGGFGIAGAPLVDRATGRVYTVSTDGLFRTIALTDGTDVYPALTLVTQPATNKVWGGLNKLGNYIYVATASDGCDSTPWRGQVYRVDVSGSPALVNNFVVVPGIPAPNGGGGIWGYGGVSIDPATGNVYGASAADSNMPEGYTPFANRMIAWDSSLNLLGRTDQPSPASFPAAENPATSTSGPRRWCSSPPTVRPWFWPATRTATCTFSAQAIWLPARSPCRSFP